MRIALVSPYDFPYPGGVTEHLAALANGLRRRGHNVQILAACSGYQNRTFPNVRVVTRTVTTFPVAGAVARVGISPFSYLRIKRILQTESFDVIHLQEPLTPGITWPVLMQAQWLPQTVTIGTFHAYHEQPNWLYAHGRPIFGWFFAKLDALIAVSEAAYQFAYQMFPGHYQIIPNGVDLERFGRKQLTTAKPAGKINILFVGRLDGRKGFRCLLESFMLLKPQYPYLKLTVIGPFDPKTCTPYQKMAQDQGVTAIDFVGYVSPERLPDFYHQADIFCAPSVGFESFGIVLLEAMAAGLPVVASDIAGYRSVVTHGQEGLLVPPGRPRYLAIALRQLIDDPALRDELGQQGRQKARLYSWDGIVEQTLALYSYTIECKQRSAQQIRPFQGMGANTYRRSVGQSYSTK